MGNQHCMAGTDPTRKLQNQTSLHTGSNPPNVHRCSHRRWHHLLGILWSAVAAISGTTRMFTRLQHELKMAKGRHIKLTTPVRDKLELWRYLFMSLTSRPTHLRDIRPNPPTWIGATNASFEAMWGVWRSPYGAWHVWRLPFSATIFSLLITEDNPKWELTINNIEFTAYVDHLHLFPPPHDPLRTHPHEGRQHGDGKLFQDIHREIG